MNDRAAISVVIAASDSVEAIERALATLPEVDDVEYLVVGPWTGRVERSHVTWIVAEPGTSVPRLRRLGLDQAQGDVVVLTEDSCAFSKTWLDGWRLAFHRPEILAASGPVGPAMGDRVVDLAVYYCEYAPFAPAPEGQERSPGRLAGNNFAIRRSLATRLDSDRIEESEVERLTRRTAAWSADALAFHVRRFELRDAIRDRLRFGHGYGKARMANRSWPWRLLGLGVGPLILATQVARLQRDAWRRRIEIGPFLGAAPVTLALLTAWSVGEWLGWSRSAFARPTFDSGRGTAVRSDAPPTGPAEHRRSHCGSSRSHA